MARGIITPADVDAVLVTAVEGLVERDRWTHELLLDPAEALEARLQLQVVVGRRLGDGGDNGNVIALGADVVRRGDDGDVNVCPRRVSEAAVFSWIGMSRTVPPAHLALWDDELQRVAVVRAGDGMIQDADGLEQVAGDGDLFGKVAWVGNDLLTLCRKGHALAAVVGPVLHRRLDAGDALAVVEELVHVGIEHVRAAVDGREAREALRQLAQAVERVDVGRLAIAGHGVDIEADAHDGLLGHALFVDVLVGRVEGHRVANEVAGRGLEAEFVVDFLHGGPVEIHACPA